MNDYKELIDSLRICVKYKKAAEALCNAEFAADAIEQLVKERDAAIADLKDHGRNCKTCLHGGRGKNDCLDREEVPCKWEWSGVQEDNDEID